jgi:uncharacterized protein YegP (UPF0339 family)
MPLKKKVWKSEADGMWFFHIVAPNGKIVAASEGYINRIDCEKTADKLIHGSILARLIAGIKSLFGVKNAANRKRKKNKTGDDAPVR